MICYAYRKQKEREGKEVKARKQKEFKKGVNLFKTDDIL